MYRLIPRISKIQIIQREEESTWDEKQRGLRGERCWISTRNPKPLVLGDGIEKTTTKTLGLGGDICVKMHYEVVMVACHQELSRFFLNLYMGLLVASMVEFISIGKEKHMPKTHLSLFRYGLVLAMSNKSL